MNQDEIVEFYNQRGAVEKQFDILKNDFGWKNLSFSKLAHNTVFLLLTAMCKNLYDYIIRQYATKYKYLNANFRIKNSSSVLFVSQLCGYNEQGKCN